MTSITPLHIGNKSFSSRLLLGTGKFSSGKVMAEALEASGTEIVTVALRRASLDTKANSHLPTNNGNNNPDILSFIDPQKYLLLPNTSGANNAQEAIRLARLAAAAGLPRWIKLEIHPDPHYLLPDPAETLQAAEVLVKEGFTVLPYIQADPVLAKRLEDVGVAAVMPLGAPIGSNRGLLTTPMIEIIIDQASVPVIIDAGIGTPSHAAAALELGADALLINTAIATASDPVQMAHAFKGVMEHTLMGLQAGLPQMTKGAIPTSPQDNLSALTPSGGISSAATSLIDFLK